MYVIIIRLKAVMNVQYILVTVFSQTIMYTRVLFLFQLCRSWQALRL